MGERFPSSACWTVRLCRIWGGATTTTASGLEIFRFTVAHQSRTHAIQCASVNCWEFEFEFIRIPISMGIRPGILRETPTFFTLCRQLFWKRSVFQPSIFLAIVQRIAKCYWWHYCQIVEIIFKSNHFFETLSNPLNSFRVKPAWLSLETQFVQVGGAHTSCFPLKYFFCIYLVKQMWCLVMDNFILCHDVSILRTY